MSFAIVKPCKTCGVVKQLLEFYDNPTMRDGHLNSCRDCVAEYKRDNRELKIETYLKRERSYNTDPKRIAARKAYSKTARGRATNRRACKAYRVTHLEKIRAYQQEQKAKSRAATGACE